MFAAVDLATGQTYYRFRDRKQWREVLDWCSTNQIEIVLTPSNAS
jgi:hypothetical protein